MTDDTTIILSTLRELRTEIRALRADIAKLQRKRSIRRLPASDSNAILAIKPALLAALEKNQLRVLKEIKSFFTS